MLTTRVPVRVSTENPASAVARWGWPMPAGMVAVGEVALGEHVIAPLFHCRAGTGYWRGTADGRTIPCPLPRAIASRM